jgi:hypothetical protein
MLMARDRSAPDRNSGALQHAAHLQRDRPSLAIALRRPVHSKFDFVTKKQVKSML